MKTVRSGGYETVIGAGCARQAGAFLRERKGAYTAYVVSDDTVFGLYGAALEGCLRAAGLNTARFVFPHGEKSKTLDTAAAILNDMAGKRICRSDAVVCLGGGVAGDLGGFCAGVYMRGMDVLQMPTTLLAAVDAGEECLRALGLTWDQILVYREHPLDKLPILLRHRLPLVLVWGEEDDLVPFTENGFYVKQAYERAGVPALFQAKPGVGHHPYGPADTDAVI